MSTPATVRTLLLIVTLGSATLGNAAESRLPDVLRALEAQGIEILEEFAIDDGLRAFAASTGGQPIAVYVTGKGNAIVGTRVGPEGSFLDEKQLDQLVAIPAAERAWARLESSSWVLDGRDDAPRIVYTFSDPNCPYCNRFWQAARPWIESGAVQLRHVMVGLIRADSANKAAAILEADNPSAALTKNETNFSNGGITALDSIAPDTRELLADHQMLMLSLGFRGTPGVIARDDTGLLQKVNGLPGPEALEKLLGPRP